MLIKYLLITHLGISRMRETSTRQQGTCPEHTRHKTTGERNGGAKSVFPVDHLDAVFAHYRLHVKMASCKTDDNRNAKALCLSARTLPTANRI